MKTAIMFVGQGSQYPNMGSDLVNDIKNKDKIDLASKIFGYDIKYALLNNNDELSNTIYTQNLVALISIILFDEYEEMGFNFDGLLGFSLGEIVALYASKIFDYETILNIIKLRAIEMNKSAKDNPGKMAAILNFDEELIINICKEISLTHLVSAVNFNSKKQVVISGTNEGVNLAIEELKKQGCRRIVELNVSGAFHTKLMANAGTKLHNFVLGLEKNKNEKEVYLNSTANVLDYNNVAKELEIQIQSPVLFYQTIENMIEKGYKNFIEIGPGNVLSQIVKKNYPYVNSYKVETIEDLVNLRGLI